MKLVARLSKEDARGDMEFRWTRPAVREIEQFVREVGQRLGDSPRATIWWLESPMFCIHVEPDERLDHMGRTNVQASIFELDELPPVEKADPVAVLDGLLQPSETVVCNSRAPAFVVAKARGLARVVEGIPDPRLQTPCVMVYPRHRHREEAMAVGPAITSLAPLMHVDPSTTKAVVDLLAGAHPWSNTEPDVQALAGKLVTNKELFAENADPAVVLDAMKGGMVMEASAATKFERRIQSDASTLRAYKRIADPASAVSQNLVSLAKMASGAERFSLQDLHASAAEQPEPLRSWIRERFVERRAIPLPELEPEDRLALSYWLDPFMHVFPYAEPSHCPAEILHDLVQRANQWSSPIRKPMPVEWQQVLAA